MQSSANSKTKAEKKFAIVSFPDEYEHLFIVASQWLLQEEFSQYSCLWPPYISEEKVKMSVLKNEKPESTWRKYIANLVIKCKTYEGAESIRDSIMKISARRSSLLIDQLQESMRSRSQTKLSSKELQFKNWDFSDSSLPIFNDIVEKLISMNIEEVSLSLKGVPKTISAESLIHLPNLPILKASTSCQTEQINISSKLNTVCDSCKSKASIATEGDTTSVGTRLHCITSLKEHEDKSLEELRVEDSMSGVNVSKTTTNNNASEAVSISDCNDEADEFEKFKPVFDSAGTKSSATLSWSAIKFKPPTETNVVMKGNESTYGGTRLQCISCMKEYEDKSFEELRMGDLCLGISSPPQFEFSQQNTTQKSLFDTMNANVFAAKWTAKKFKPPTETDVMVISEIPFFIGTRLQCITCMKEYEDKSLEELRVEELSYETSKTSMQPPNPFIATFPFSSTFSFTFKKPISKPRIYPLLFGSTGTTGIGALSHPAIKFKPVEGSDTILKDCQMIPVNTRFQCITCMKEYEDKSFEELRMGFLVADHKERSPVGTVFQKLGLISTFKTVPTVSFSGSNCKPAFDVTDIANEFRRTEASSYTAIKFKPVTGPDTILKENHYKTLLQSISCMKEYEDKSFEELRVEDLVAHHKVKFPVFGTHAQPTPFTFTFRGEKSKSAFDTKDITSSLNEHTNKSTFGVNIQPAWHHSPYVSSFTSGAKSLF